MPTSGPAWPLPRAPRGRIQGAKDWQDDSCWGLLFKGDSGSGALGQRRALASSAQAHVGVVLVPHLQSLPLAAPSQASSTPAMPDAWGLPAAAACRFDHSAQVAPFPPRVGFQV